jgi:hypothetical protein
LRRCEDIVIRRENFESKGKTSKITGRIIGETVTEDTVGREVNAQKSRGRRRRRRRRRVAKIAKD